MILKKTGRWYLKQSQGVESKLFSLIGRKALHNLTLLESKKFLPLCTLQVAVATTVTIFIHFIE
jgi:hypothetical protein